MRRALAGLGMLLGLVGCGSSPSPHDLLIGTWLHEPDAAHPEIPTAVTYRSDQTMTVQSLDPKMPGTTEGKWAIDSRNLLNMSLMCGLPPTCFGSRSVNYRVSEDSLTWIWADASEWRFHK